MNLFHGCIAVLRFAGWLITAGLVLHGPGMLPGWAADEGGRQLVHLYFADATRPLLIAEARIMVNPGEPTAFSRQLVLELINGSARGNLATIPKETRLRSFFLLGDGTAVVDFSAHLQENHPGSCRLEQLTLFSIVNSLILNVPEVDQVQILVDGAEVQTLAGHLPLEFPLTADMLLTR
ncbi:MAG: GerMN domain-containing protein [Desulfobacteraceae bacterium]|jgi:spore germination protein GerM|nr:GerMN domain-containing protein [Desulfobacteraceae bacterium]